MTQNRVWVVDHWSVMAPRVINLAYPDSDLLAVGPPKQGESIASYAERCNRKHCGDGLFAFLVNEADEEGLTPSDYINRLDRAIADIRAVRSAFEREV